LDGGLTATSWWEVYSVQASYVPDVRDRPDASMPLLGLLEDLKGRRAVVTGAARGIGEEIAKSLIAAGADVTVVDRDGDRLKEAFRGTPTQVMDGDLNGDVEALAADLTMNGPVELVVNNVGITTPHRLLEIGPPELDLVLGTNLRGPWLFTQHLVQALIADGDTRAGRAARRGSILFVSSLHDRFVAREAHYSVSKAGVSMLVQAMAKDLGRHGIRVNAISPGWIRTAEDPTTPEQVAKRARLLPRIPAGEPGVPADVARVALFLLSDAWSGYMTGQNIAVDGGLSLHNWLDE
jgi:NAD(P)-dependent dehydrogenase (short-subunit alcohol dehydrogenase family)